jgi:hypothetical protein
LDHRINGALGYASVLRCRAFGRLRDTFIELDVLLRCHGKHLAIVHQQLHPGASWGLDDFSFLQNVPRFEGAAIAVGIDRKCCAVHGYDCGDLRHESAPVSQKLLRLFAQKNGM